MTIVIPDGVSILDAPTLDELPATAQRLLERIESRQAVVGVLGLGYVGLPLAVGYAQAGFRVIGFDVDPERVALLNNGTSPVPDVDSETVAALVTPITDVCTFDAADRGHPRRGSLSFTADFSALRSIDAVIICVPTPLDKTGDPDMSFVMSAAERIAAHLHMGMLIVLESTTYPGTTEEVILPLLQNPAQTRLRRRGDKQPEIDVTYEAGEDFFLAFSPERIDPGRTDYTVKTTPKVIGGLTRACKEVAVALYGSVIDDVVPVSDPKTAELVKLLENTFRAVNIGLVNELAIMCDRLGVNAWEVIGAASTKPFGFMPFYPGPGLGGHCIPIDPLYLAWKLRTLDYHARFIHLAAEINENMPEYVLDKVVSGLNANYHSVNGARVLVIGVAYKANVNDVRESPALELIEMLAAKGAQVSYHDPYVPSVRVGETHYKTVSLDIDRLEAADCVLIHTAHDDIPWQLVADHTRLVVDTRNVMATTHPTVARVITLGGSSDAARTSTTTATGRNPSRS